MGRLRALLHAARAAFANPDLGRMLISWAAMSFATWGFAIALGVYAFDLGGSTAVGIVAAIRLFPGVIATPFAGVLGDRHSRRLVLLLCTATTAVVLGLAGAAAALDAPAAVVYVLAGVFTVASSPYIPAEGAFFPFLARTPQELSAANVARGVADNVGFLLGAVATGFLLVASGPALVFGLTALAAATATLVIAGVRPDSRPDYAGPDAAAGIIAETTRGARALISGPGLRLAATAIVLISVFEGAADVLVVSVALQLLDLGRGSVGFLNALWGLGAVASSAVLVALLERGRLTVALALGCLMTGLATALTGAWAIPVVAYFAWLGIGAGFNLTDVAARTLLQRLGSDEVLGRVMGSLETARVAAMALGSILVPVALALFGVRGALFVLGALLPLFVLIRWGALRRFEIGAPVSEAGYALLRADPIFEPLPVATLERLTHALITLRAAPGEEVIAQGDHGDHFYLIESGEVEVLEGGELLGLQGPGESFGEIALLRDVPRTATVRARTDTVLRALEREQFISAVTGHDRSHEAAHATADERRPSGASAS